MKAVLHSFAYGLDYLREQVQDISSPDMVVQPKGFKNHPAWTIGHLAFSCQAIGGEIGLSPWLPHTWAIKYGSGSTPRQSEHDYPSKDESLRWLRDAQTRVDRAVRELSEAQLDQPLPDEAFRKVLPTIRHAITQVLIAHVAYHVGQISLWRVAMGLPSMQRSFL